MSITGFVQAYFKPSRWWRRRKSIEITVWPQFLAQALCPHDAKVYFGVSDTPEEKNIWRCEDCFKFHYPQGIYEDTPVVELPNGSKYVVADDGRAIKLEDKQ